MFLNTEAPFLDEISRLGILKLLGLDTYDTLTMKVKFEGNKAGSKWFNQGKGFRPTEQ